MSTPAECFPTNEAWGGSFSLKNVVIKMLPWKENWLTVSFAIVKIQKKLLKSK